ncbi:MAG TPA: nicotinate-nucleotide--dimethylbenzimidazole phosphoribosyltransferase [Victivallales bacterium]|nr:nicotinate-nucleotide--dimethylbenzimidazole phosphoribosyltransferase [Victivallales bacterium]
MKITENLMEIINKISPPNKEIASSAQQKLNNLTKPRGSLGILEECAIKYLSIRGNMNAKLENTYILTFAGDHGVAEEGVSAFPQKVTTQMLKNFANGGAAINVLSKHANAKLKVIDVGVAGDYNHPSIIKNKIAKGTANFAKTPAMTQEDCCRAIMAGAKIAEECINEGADLICTGDMGIANTTSSAAIYSILLDLPAEEIVGRGTGIDDQRLRKKIEIVNLAREKYSKLKSDPLAVMAAVGGFEIAAICGAIIQSAERKIPIMIDGFISGAAALTAIKLKNEILDYCFFSHLSAENGHSKALKLMGVKPLLSLDLRLGEGTGAALAIHIVSASIKIINQMATFSSANVSTEI